MMCSCQQAEELMDAGQAEPTTRAFSTLNPKLVVYVETNDVNPLNAGDYYLGAVSANNPLVSIVELFASNIHKENFVKPDGTTEVRPTLYLNDKLTHVLEPEASAPTTTGYHKYVKGLQDKGIKVLLTVLGDWQGIGVANMTDTQADQFAAILCHVVTKYGLDGIGFDDEYSDYTSTNSTSYSRIITKLRDCLPAGKLISVFDWGYTNTISNTAGQKVDYGYPGNFSAYTFETSWGISGLTKAKWSPMALNLGNSYSSGQLDYIFSNAEKAAAQGYGAMMCFNLRPTSNRSPLPVFEAIAEGAYANPTVTIASGGGNRTQDWTFKTGGFTITYDDAIAQ